MSLAMGSLAFPQVTSAPIVPIHNGLNSFSHFQNQQVPIGQNLPWQQDQQKQSLWQVIQQNRQHIERPISFQQQTNNSTNQTNQFPWQRNNFLFNQRLNQNQTDEQSQNSAENKWEDLWQQKNDTSKASDAEDQASEQASEQEEDSKKEEEDSKKEEEDDAMEEMQEEFEEWLDKMDEKKKELYEDFQIYLILMVPYLMHSKPIANYFAAAELLSVILTKLGINDDDNLAFMLFVQCVDIVALSRGRFKLVDGYKQNWYQEIYDYVLTKLSVPDAIRLGTQMFMPQSPAPEYETR